ncbi:MAG: ribonuclease M5 [Coprobacillaceae bacterium]
MKEIKEIVVVEGKTDTAVLKELFIVDTIETMGLQLPKETLEIIKEANKARGVIVLTDPDFPGKKIRDQIQTIVPNCKHAFIHRKDAIGKKKLGVAEARKEAIIEALENCVTFSKTTESITWSEFLSLNIVGDKKRRLEVYNAFHLGYGNVKTLFKRLNMIGITKQQIIEIIGE